MDGLNILFSTDAGYDTAFIGKYMNNYGKIYFSKTVKESSYTPPGWNFWAGLVGNSVYVSLTNLNFFLCQ